MKKLFLVLGFLASALIAQEVKQVGQKVTQISAVTWTTGANTGKTRILFLGNSVYLDTSSTGQTGAWKRIDNTSDSCSNAFLLAADTNGATRSAGDYGLWGLVRSVDADSSTHLYRMQYRERVYNGTAKAPQFTPWTRVGANSIFNGAASPDTVAFPNAGTTSKISQFALFSAPLGTLARFCPDDVDGTAGAASDSVFVDSLRVYAFAIPVDVKSASGSGSSGPGAEGTVDLTGINGVTPSTGNGTTGTGSLRVTIASNNTAFTVNAAQATASSLNAEVQGDAAHDATASGNPVQQGGVASAAAPTSVSADGDAVAAWYLRNGAQATVVTAAGALVGGDASNGLDVDVTRLPALVAGTANIGDVDVASIAAGDNNIGNVDVVTLPALAAGTNNIGDVDVLSLNDGGNSVTVDNGGTFAVQAGQAAHDAAIAGNPVRTGLRAATAHPTAVATGDQVDQLGTVEGKLVNQPYAVHGETWRYAAASGGITDATAVTVKTAAGSGIRNCVTSIQVINGHATVSTEVWLVDGAAGTVIWRGFAQAAGGGVAAEFPVPICGSANTLLEVDNGTTGSAVYYNLQGFESQE
jgi:hypothetical protein